LTFYFHILTTMHGQNHIKIIMSVAVVVAAAAAVVIVATAVVVAVAG